MKIALNYFRFVKYSHEFMIIFERLIIIHDYFSFKNIIHDLKKNKNKICDYKQKSKNNS